MHTQLASKQEEKPKALKAPALKAKTLKVPRSIALKAPKSGGIVRRSMTRDELMSLKFEV